MLWKSGSAPVENFAPSLDAASIRQKPEAPFRESARAVDLTAAEIIVSVGRGIKEKENIPIVEELAKALGAELAASRPICDAGWLPMERQVGSSGQTVAPKVYMAIGISGAIQHLVGMKGAKTIVAINKDANAPIFEVADYGIVGDLFEVVPALVEEVKKSEELDSLYGPNCGAANRGGKLACQRSFRYFKSRLERAAAAKIGGPTRATKTLKQLSPLVSPQSPL